MDRWRAFLGIAALVSLGFWFPWSRSVKRGENAEAPVAIQKIAPQPSGFERQVKPVLAARCQPCHFPGGIMHARLPFDDPRTIRKLGTALFTRIRDEKERAAIRAFLTEP
jgi:hypothetical protein